MLIGVNSKNWPRSKQCSLHVLLTPFDSVSWYVWVYDGRTRRNCLYVMNLVPNAHNTFSKKVKLRIFFGRTLVIFRYRSAFSSLDDSCVGTTTDYGCRREFITLLFYVSTPFKKGLRKSWKPLWVADTVRSIYILTHVIWQVSLRNPKLSLLPLWVALIEVYQVGIVFWKYNILRDLIFHHHDVNLRITVRKALHNLYINLY